MSQLATKAGIDWKTVARFEAGGGETQHLSTVEAIAAALGKPPDYFSLVAAGADPDAVDAGAAFQSISSALAELEACHEQCRDRFMGQVRQVLAGLYTPVP